jgi:hypothetical protein
MYTCGSVLAWNLESAESQVWYRMHYYVFISKPAPLPAPLGLL